MLIETDFLNCLLGHDIPSGEENLNRPVPLDTREAASVRSPSTDSSCDTLRQHGPLRELQLIPATNKSTDTREASKRRQLHPPDSPSQERHGTRNGKNSNANYAPLELYREACTLKSRGTGAKIVARR